MMLDIAGGILIAAFIIVLFILGVSLIGDSNDEHHPKGLIFMAIAVATACWIIFR